MKRRSLPRLLLGAMLSLACPGADLPPGVPNPLTPDGKYSGGIRFTTMAYNNAALDLLLREANIVAKELDLPEDLPITKSDVALYFISPFGDSYVNHRIGNVTTKNYKYGVAAGYKFSQLHRAGLDELCIKYRRMYQLPIAQIDTNAAHRLATQFLAAVRVDVAALDRDHPTRIKPNDFWNRVNPGEELKSKTFVPIYDISWAPPATNKAPGGSTAYVQLFEPTKTLLELVVNYPQYIHREPLVFTNLSELLPGTNAPPPQTNGPPATGPRP